MLSGAIPSSNSTSLSPRSRHRPSPSPAPSASSHTSVPHWVAKPGSCSRAVSAKREPSLDKGSSVSDTHAPLRPIIASPNSVAPPSHPTIASAAASEAVAASLRKAKANSNLSLAAIVAAYKKDGNGDRELLVALLEAKKMEDKRLAARDNLHAEQFRAQNLHYAYTLASTYPPPHFLVHPQQPLLDPHGRPARAGPSSARSRSASIASIASSSTASITVAHAASPTFGPPQEVNDGKRKRAGSVRKVTREEAMQALRAKIARSTGSSSASDASVTWEPSTEKAKGEQVPNGMADGDTDDEDIDDDDEEDYDEPDDDESRSRFRSHSSLSASPRMPTDPSRPRVPASSSAQSPSPPTSKSLAMLLEVVDQEQRGLGFVRPVMTA